MNRHFVETEIVVERMNRHLCLDFKAARQDWVGFHESEGERAVPGHDVSDVGAEQAVDRATNQPVSEVVEWPLVLLEVCGAESVADHHVVSFEDFRDHGRGRIRRIGVVAVRHHVHVGVNVLEHGADYVALALTRFLADDCSFGGSYFRCAVSGVVVVHIHVSARQCGLEITHHLADGDFLVIARQKHRDPRIFLHGYHYSDIPVTGIGMHLRIS